MIFIKNLDPKGYPADHFPNQAGAFKWSIWIIRIKFQSKNSCRPFPIVLVVTTSGQRSRTLFLGENLPNVTPGEWGAVLKLAYMDFHNRSRVVTILA